MSATLLLYLVVAVVLCTPHDVSRETGLLSMQRRRAMGCTGCTL